MRRRTGSSSSNSLGVLLLLALLLLNLWGCLLLPGYASGILDLHYTRDGGLVRRLLYRCTIVWRPLLVGLWRAVSVTKGLLCWAAEHLSAAAEGQWTESDRNNDDYRRCTLIVQVAAGLRADLSTSSKWLHVFVVRLEVKPDWPQLSTAQPVEAGDRHHLSATAAGQMDYIN